MKILQQHFSILISYSLFYFSLISFFFHHTFLFFLSFSSFFLLHTFPLSLSSLFFFLFFSSTSSTPKHSRSSLFLSLSHINSLSYTHREREREKWRLAFYMFFFFCSGLISVILLFRFHQTYEKDCFCVSNLSIWFCVFVLIVVCFSL